MCGFYLEVVWLWRISGGYLKVIMGLVLRSYLFTCLLWSFFEREKILNNQVIFFLKNVITFGTSDRNATNYFMYWWGACVLPPLLSSCISNKPVYSTSSVTWLMLSPVHSKSQTVLPGEWQGLAEKSFDIIDCSRDRIGFRCCIGMGLLCNLANLILANIERSEVARDSKFI